MILFFDFLDWFDLIEPSRSNWEVAISLVIGRLFDLGFLTLLPFWFGVVVKHTDKLKLLLVPTVPWAIYTVFLTIGEFDGANSFLSEFWQGMVALLTVVTGLATFLSWIIAWFGYTRWNKAVATPVASDAQAGGN